jgi:hypothetical protein
MGYTTEIRFLWVVPFAENENLARQTDASLVGSNGRSLVDSFPDTFHLGLPVHRDAVPGLYVSTAASPLTCWDRN